MLARCLFWLAVLSLATLSAFVSGCAQPQPQTCYQLVGINPPKGEAILFDACRGGLLFLQLPPAPPAPTTTTTLPSF